MGDWGRFNQAPCSTIRRHLAGRYGGRFPSLVGASRKPALQPMALRQGARPYSRAADGFGEYATLRSRSHLWAESEGA
jgi:hypothetical protein